MKTPAEQAAWIREFRAAKRAAGRCWRCNNPARPGGSLCQEHREHVTRHERQAHQSPWELGVECLTITGLPVMVACCSDEHSVYVCRHDLIREERQHAYRDKRYRDGIHWTPKACRFQVPLPLPCRWGHASMKRAEILQAAMTRALTLAGLPGVLVRIKAKPWPCYPVEYGMDLAAYNVFMGIVDPDVAMIRATNEPVPLDNIPVELPWGKPKRVHKNGFSGENLSF